MGILFGFAPWLVYWILVGNVPFLAAVLIALTTAVAALVHPGDEVGVHHDLLMANFASSPKRDSPPMSSRPTCSLRSPTG